MKKADRSPKGYKTLWETEKLLVSSNFFSCSVFKRLVLLKIKTWVCFLKGYCKVLCNETESCPTLDQTYRHVEHGTMMTFTFKRVENNTCIRY